jgi:hypothetical protein
MLTLHRLQPSDRTSWGLFPVFEQRVRAFLHEFSPEFTKSQEEQFIVELRQRFAVTPALAGYWLVMTGEGLAQTVVGHLCSWIQATYGKPYVLLYQLECLKAWESKEMFREAMRQTVEWIAGVNRELTAAARKTGDQPQLIERVEHWTVRDPEAWLRFLPELTHERVMTVMRLKIEAPRETHVNGAMH